METVRESSSTRLGWRWPRWVQRKEWIRDLFEARGGGGGGDFLGFLVVGGALDSSRVDWGCLRLGEGLEIFWGLMGFEVFDGLVLFLGFLVVLEIFEGFGFFEVFVTFGGVFFSVGFG